MHDSSRSQLEVLLFACLDASLARSLAGWLAVFRSAWSVKARMSSMWKAFRFRQYASSRHFTNELTILRAAQLFSILSPEHGGSAAQRGLAWLARARGVRRRGVRGVRNLCERRLYIRRRKHRQNYLLALRYPPSTRSSRPPLLTDRRSINSHSQIEADFLLPVVLELLADRHNSLLLAAHSLLSLPRSASWFSSTAGWGT